MMELYGTHPNIWFDIISRRAIEAVTSGVGSKTATLYQYDTSHQRYYTTILPNRKDGESYQDKISELCHACSKYGKVYLTDDYNAIKFYAWHNEPETADIVTALADVGSRYALSIQAGESDQQKELFDIVVTVNFGHDTSDKIKRSKLEDLKYILVEMRDALNKHGIYTPDGIFADVASDGFALKFVPYVLYNGVDGND